MTSKEVKCLNTIRYRDNVYIQQTRELDVPFSLCPLRSTHQHWPVLAWHCSRWKKPSSSHRGTNAPTQNNHNNSIRWPSIPNFSGQSRKNTRSFGTLNCPKFRILSRLNVKMCFCSSRSSKCSWLFWRFCLTDAFCWAQNTPNPFSAPTGGAYDAPPDLRIGWRGRCPHTSPPRRRSRSVPKFYNRFMVTL